MRNIIYNNLFEKALSYSLCCSGENIAADLICTVVINVCTWQGIDKFSVQRYAVRNGHTLPVLSNWILRGESLSCRPELRRRLATNNRGGRMTCRQLAHVLWVPGHGPPRRRCFRVSILLKVHFPTMPVRNNLSWMVSSPDGGIALLIIKLCARFRYT